MSAVAAAVSSSAANAIGSRVSSSTSSRFSQCARHNGVRLIVGGWTLFVGENLILSHNRTEIIDRLGEGGYHGIYNSLSGLACSSIAYGYMRYGRRQGPRLWTVTMPMRMASVGLSGLGVLCFAQLFPSIRNPAAFFAPSSSGSTSGVETGGRSMKRLCPMDFEADRELSRIDQGPRGAKRVTRHASLWSFALVGAGCALRTPFAPEVAMFLSPALVVAILGAHIDHRYRRGIGGELDEKHDWPHSSHIPFLALVCGEQSWSQLWAEIKPMNSTVALGGLGLWALTHFRR